MKNSNSFNSDSLKKCPYESQVYKANNIDLIYVKSYKGDWGHWDDKCESAHLDKSSYEQTDNESITDPENNINGATM
ncbi:hypothetical protein ASF10_21470 [Flavobacterium sp. Leaf82]|jgi:hypothetical protein|uniref:hypothetical protein n=1 Tax=unclassified Flavobacterium TaxID=196869 RepID=UPI0006F2CE09|nr:hypothetical protein [Flavobacterium sp. Leaf82]KQO32147.1 hypothetical protein ASF10_21470 [Flavobacterium sp. Leaf82]